MTKSEFLKQYKGMLVGAVGVFIGYQLSPLLENLHPLLP
jgi:xanthosine utilization system XapX-like protein